MRTPGPAGTEDDLHLARRSGLRCELNECLAYGLFGEVFRRSLAVVKAELDAAAAAAGAARADAFAAVSRGVFCQHTDAEAAQRLRVCGIGSVACNDQDVPNLIVKACAYLGDARVRGAGGAVRTLHQRQARGDGDIGERNGVQRVALCTGGDTVEPSLSTGHRR